MGLAACSSGSAGAFHAPMGGTALASALDQVPDMPDVYVFFTDWAAMGHRAPSAPGAASFAGQLLGSDTDFYRDLGLRSTDSQWELDVDRLKQPPLILLGFDEHTDLSGVADKLAGLGYHANGSVFTGAADPIRMWTMGLTNIGLDPRRHLFVGGRDMSAVRATLAGPANALGRSPAVTPSLALVEAKLGHVATAYVAVGSMACVKLSDLLRIHGTPAILAALRRQFPGTFDPPQAEIMALANPAS